jgi:hypothetical protein
VQGASNDYIVGGTNMGIGSVTPGQALDVQGAIRTTFSNQVALDVEGTVKIGGGGGIGIGTTFAGQAGNDVLSVMSGNVGIGTWVAGSSGLNIATSGNTYFGGNVGIGSLSPQSALVVFGGDIRSTGTAPSASTCGSSPVVAGTDNAFNVTFSSTACTITFNTAKKNAPTCICSQENTATLPTCSASTSAVTCATTVSAAGDLLNCICIPN